MKPTTIYEDEDYRRMNLTTAAELIMMNVLTPGAVVFELNAEDFEHHTQAYELIEQQIGPFKNKGGRPIFKYGRDRANRMLLEVMFKYKDDTEKALTKGLTVGEFVFKAAPVAKTEGNQSEQAKLCEIHLSQLPYHVDDTTLVQGICNSMAYFGKVMQIVKLTDHDWFEGEVKISLNLT
ncbi:hypothetical protein DM01DRAFT_283306, partial [Hesseltinella vesiculosa]